MKNENQRITPLYPEHEKNNTAIIIENRIREMLNLDLNEEIPTPFHQGSYKDFDALRRLYNNICINGGCQAYDIFGKKFLIDPENCSYVIEQVAIIIKEIVNNNPNLDIETALLETDLRFIVYYKKENKNESPKKNILLDFPTDIYKYLIENDYDKNFIEFITNEANIFAQVESSDTLHQNAVKIFKHLLQVSKGNSTYRIKLSLLGEDTEVYKMGCVNHILKKHKPVSLTDNKFMDFCLNNMYIADEIDKRFNKKNVDINKMTLLSRLYNGMSFDDAARLSIEELEKYGYSESLYRTSSNLHIVTKRLREVFYKIIREQMRNERDM